MSLRAPDDDGLALLRFMLALDADTTEFVERFRRDPLLGPSIRHLHGLRPLRRTTVAHAVLRASAASYRSEARARDRAGDPPSLRRRRADPRGAGRVLAGGAAPPGARDPPRLRTRPDLPDARPGRAARPARRSSRNAAPARASIGPWSLGVIALEGLGSYRYGLVGDLALVKLCAALWGRWVELEETAELLEPYGEWAGLACAYLMAGFGRGLVPGAIRTSRGSCAFAQHCQRRKIACVRLGANSKIDLIRRVPLFSSASKPQLAEIASIADEIDLPADKTIIKEGDTGREFFVLIEGTADVQRGGRKVAEIGPGDFVGEIALISKTPRNATITTTSPVRALVITDRAFRQLLDHSPQIQIGVLTALAERLAPTSL